WKCAANSDPRPPLVSPGIEDRASGADGPDTSAPWKCAAKPGLGLNPGSLLVDGCVGPGDVPSTMDERTSRPWATAPAMKLTRASPLRPSASASCPATSR